MSDAAGFGQVTMRARLVREIGESEAKQRNALSIKRPGLTLRQGTQVTVLETLEQGQAFLSSSGKSHPTRVTGSACSTPRRSSWKWRALNRPPKPTQTWTS